MKYNKNMFVIGIIVILGIGVYFFSSKKLFSYISYPFLKVYSHIEGIEYRSKQVLYAELQKAHQEKNELLSENISLSAQLVFLHDTHDIRQFSRRYEERVVVTAHVLARHLSEEEQYVLIDAGSEQAIKKGMIVISYNQLVGVVTDVFPWYAKVRLITDTRSCIGGRCMQTGEPGVVQGNNTAGLSFLYISHTKHIVRGDVVQSNGNSGLFPRGFALGKIVHAEDGDLYYNILLEPLISFNNMEYCTVLHT